MEETNKQILPQVDESEKGGEILLGKFKDVNALLDAYNSLQSEFTKRCQRLKELEKMVETDKQSPISTEQVSEESTEKVITQEEKNEILKDYLKSVLNSKQKAVLIEGTGVGVKTPSEKPKSIAEAGSLAKKFFN